MNLLAVRNFRLAGYSDFRRAIYDLCVESYRANLRGEWKLEPMEGDIPGSFQAGFVLMEQEIFRRIRALCKDGHAVFLVDADTACVRPTDIWNRGWDRMVMPWGGRNCDQLNGYQPLMSSGVIYFPPTISERAWDVGQAAFDAMDCNSALWGEDQKPYNAMVRVDGSLLFAPELNWSIHQDMQNPVPEPEALIKHICASRGLDTIALMREAIEAARAGAAANAA